MTPGDWKIYQDVKMYLLGWNATLIDDQPEKDFPIMQVILSSVWYRRGDTYHYGLEYIQYTLRYGFSLPSTEQLY